MKIKALLGTLLLSLLPAMQAGATTLNVSSAATPDSGLYDYAYTFTVTGGTGVNNLFLGSDDLSPLNVSLTLNGAVATGWSYLGNNTPQNYLQFFTSGTGLGTADTFRVTFVSLFAPGTSGFAVGLDGAGAATNEVTGVKVPSATAMPEPASAALLAAGLGIAVLAGLAKSRTGLNS